MVRAGLRAKKRPKRKWGDLHGAAALDLEASEGGRTQTSRDGVGNSSAPGAVKIMMMNAATKRGGAGARIASEGAGRLKRRQKEKHTRQVWMFCERKAVESV